MITLAGQGWHYSHNSGRPAVASEQPTCYKRTKAWSAPPNPRSVPCPAAAPAVVVASSRRPLVSLQISIRLHLQEHFPMDSSPRRFSPRFSLDTWAVFAAIAAAIIVRASHIRIPW